MPSESESTYFILSVDGGGIRGVFPAHLLDCLEVKIGIDPREKFDFLAGTSTGSIIAAALAIGIDPSEIASLYREEGDSIFGKPVKSLYPNRLKFAAHSKYRNDGLRSALTAVFGDQRLGDVSKPLLLPAVDVGNGGVHVFKSQYDAGFTRDADIRFVDAIMASCAAPTFFDPITVDSYLLCDGGLWANNPSMAAVIDAQRRLGVVANRMRVFSLGTGHSRTEYGTGSKREWGIANGWQKQKFTNFLMSLQSQSTANYLQLLLEPHQVLRLNFESDVELQLDDVSAIGDLVSKADKVFTYKSDAIRQFLT